MPEANDDRLYAEDRPYWNTTVQPSKSLGELMAQLDRFGILKHEVRQGQVYGEVAWLIRFEFREKTHRFVFTPRPCRDPDAVRSFSGARRTHARQAVFQMGRTAAHFVKNLLAAADDQPAALFGFVELPGVFHAGELPATAAELEVAELTGALAELKVISPFAAQPLALRGEGEEAAENTIQVVNDEGGEPCQHRLTSTRRSL